MTGRRTTLAGKAGPVHVDRGGGGVPHVSAPDADDALAGLGYCHARDRALQMLMVRILGRGQGSRFLRSDDEMLEIDKFLRRLDFGRDDAEQEARLSPRARAAVDAYCRGANAAFDRHGTPWELRLLGYNVRDDPWTFSDMNLTGKMIGYVALAIGQADVERWLLEMVQAGVPRGHLEELFPGRLGDLDVELLREVRLGERIIPEGLWREAGIPKAASSNNWVVAGGKSASGLPIACNDPHLQLDRIPAVWYEAVLRWGDGHYAMGATLPGAPGVVAGRNADLAWSVTYAFMDCVDSWVEDCRDGQYRRGDDWLPFRVRDEIIRRKGKPPVAVRYHENDHGTLEGDPHEAGHYLAARWSCGEGTGAESMAAITGMLGAKTVEEGRAHLSLLNNSCWCWLLADRDGSIGFQMSGRMPLRRPGASGLVPLAGWDPENDWRGYADPQDLPRATDPPEGFLVTANDDLNALGRLDPIRLTLAPYRAERIREVLARPGLVDVEQMKALQFDLQSTQAGQFLEVARPILARFPGEPNAKFLAEWDLSYRDDSPGPTLFEAFYRALIEEAFGGHWGPSVMEHLLDHSGILLDSYGLFDRVLLGEASAWFGGRTRAEVYEAALARVMKAPARPWGEGRGMILKHLVLGGKLPRWLGFDRGPIPLKGGRATVHQGQFASKRGRASTFGPSYRLIADLATDEMHTTLPGGPSDRRTSRWYASGLLDWLEGRYRVLRGRPDPRHPD